MKRLLNGRMPWVFDPSVVMVKTGSEMLAGTVGLNDNYFKRAAAAATHDGDVPGRFRQWPLPCQIGCNEDRMVIRR